jgi:hypothetical protein
MDVQSKPTFFDGKFWKIISNASVLHWLWQIGGSSAAVYLVHKVGLMQNLAGSSAVFFLTLFSLSGTTRAAIWAIPRLKRWINPPSLMVISRGGEGASVEIPFRGSYNMGAS